MRSEHRTLLRAAVVGGAALVAGVFAAPGAQAVSDEIRYTCDYSVGERVGTGSVTATFDSGVVDGLVVTAGEFVSLDPITGSVTLPQEFTDALRQDGLTSIRGAGSIFLGIQEPADKLGEATFQFDADIPAEGPFTVPVSGQIGEYQPQKAGTYTLVTGAELFFFLDPEGPDGDSGLTCTPDGGGDTAIDVFTATAATTPTRTVTTTASPVRPVVVQTDFAGEGPALPLPLALGVGVIGLAGLAAGVTRVARRPGPRRH